ncbi:MAG: hypothetical protein ACJ74Z_06025 [Bryobacteraceae bacterium]|jgi:hypothetical protein
MSVSRAVVSYRSCKETAAFTKLYAASVRGSCLVLFTLLATYLYVTKRYIYILGEEYS